MADWRLMSQISLPVYTRVRLARPLGGYVPGVECDIVEVRGTAAYEVDFGDGSGTHTVPQTHVVAAERFYPMWREIWWQVTVFFWILGLLLRGVWRRYVGCWRVERAPRLSLTCARCGQTNLASCRAPGRASYRCIYSGSHRAMPSTCCPHRRARDGAWCRLPAEDGHAQHEFYQECGESEGGAERAS